MGVLQLRKACVAVDRTPVEQVGMDQQRRPSGRQVGAELSLTGGLGQDGRIERPWRPGQGLLLGELRELQQRELGRAPGGARQTLA